MKKNPNDGILDKSGEFFLKPFVSIMYIVFDFRRVQLVGSLKVFFLKVFKGLFFKGLFLGLYSSYWWVLLGSWSVPAGFWSVHVLVYASDVQEKTIDNRFPRNDNRFPRNDNRFPRNESRIRSSIKCKQMASINVKMVET